MIKTLNIDANITADRQLHITIPDDVPLGPAQVVLTVSSSGDSTTSTLGSFADSEFFGMWADRTDIMDGVEYARELRTRGWKRSA